MVYYEYKHSGFYLSECPCVLKRLLCCWTGFDCWIASEQITRHILDTELVESLSRSPLRSLTRQAVHRPRNFEASFCSILFSLLPESEATESGAGDSVLGYEWCVGVLGRLAREVGLARTSLRAFFSDHIPCRGRHPGLRCPERPAISLILTKLQIATR